MSRFLLLLASLLAASASTGCIGHTCTDEARSSLRLFVVDAETGERVDATVTFLLDGEGPQSPEQGIDGEFWLGSEDEGAFEVTIAADGYETAVRQYEVTSDECHVQTVEDTVELTPTA
jgi:hypothetical protein